MAMTFSQMAAAGLFGVAVLSSAQAETSKSQVGNFIYEKSKDVMSDVQIEIAYAQSLDNPDMNIVFRCDADNKRVAITHDYMIGVDSNVSVMYRVDDRDAVGYESWDLLRDNESSVVKIYKMERILDAITQAEQIIFRVRDGYDGDTNTGSFDTEGSEEVLSRLSCFDY